MISHALTSDQRQAAHTILAKALPPSGDRQGFYVAATNTLLAEGCFDSEILDLLNSVAREVTGSDGVELPLIQKQRELVFTGFRCDSLPQLAGWQTYNRAQVRRAGPGRTMATAVNLLTIFQEDSRFKGALTFDPASDEFVWVRDVAPGIRAGDAYREIHTNYLVCLLSDFDSYGMATVTIRTLERALHAAAHLHPRNGFLDWLDSHPARGGTATLDATLDAMRVAPSDRWMVLQTLQSIYQRAREPGCRVGPLLTLRGGRGFFEQLVPPRYFLKMGAALDERNMAGRIRGKALAELGAWRSPESERVIAMAAATHDRFFGGLRDRLTLFVAVTDADFYLAPKWKHRFWVVDCQPPTVVMDDAWRAQLWGEVRGLAR